MHRKIIHRTMKYRDMELQWSRDTLIMGILNVTPDSFSDGGKFNDLARSLEHAKQLVNDGADIIDVGGESTRPGATPVSLEEELNRVIPIIKNLREHLDIPISVDTYKSEVARLALEAGAHIINDVWGLKKDPNMAKVIAEYGCPIVIMHNRLEPNYSNLIDDVIADLEESIQIAHQAGVKDEQIILDPGIGFAKTLEHNLILMNHLYRVVQMGYPVLLGTSRKSMIKKTLNLPATDVIEGTAATVTFGINQGCQMIRVHDVLEMKKVVLMTDAMLQAGG
jgi:dihydropteroate synthase